MNENMMETNSQSSSPLSAEEVAILELEKRRWKYPGTKEQAIRQELHLSPIAYYQKLNKLIEDARAVRREPALTRRLREHRDSISAQP